jgi:hypothetical protein
MKYRNFAAFLLLAALLLLSAHPLTAAETAGKTVLLKVHVPFTGG